MKRQVLLASAGFLLAGALTSGAQEGPSAAELKALIEKQSQLIENLSNRVKELESKPSDVQQVQKGLMETNEALAETNKKLDKTDSRLAFGKGIDGLTLTGDLRLRYEARDRSIDTTPADGNDGDRTRIRDRFRLGAVWLNKAESWEIGAGLATGNARTTKVKTGAKDSAGKDVTVTIPAGTSDGRSTNSDWGRNGTFDHQEIWLDYAYAKHKWDRNGTPLSLTMGQMKTPFVNTAMTWDGDLRPTGVAAQYGDPLKKDYRGPFLTLGVFEVAYLSDGSVIGGDPRASLDDNVFWLAAQTGYKYTDDDQTFLGMLGWQHITDAYRNAANWYVYSQDPNTVYGGVDTGYTYDIAEGYIEYQRAVSGVTLRPYAHVAYNLGAEGNRTQGGASGKPGNNAVIDPEKSQNALAWMLGLDVKRGRWSLGYGYARIGADAVFGPMRDSDFGETAGLVDTDIQGHIVRLGCDLTRNLNLGASYLLLSRIKGGSSNDAASAESDSAKLLQLDLVYKF